jgi:DNA-binding NarL/FixJ family response regulator
MDRLRILVADDHTLVRQGLVAMLSGEPDMEVVAEAANGRQAWERAKELQPDIVLMDLRMPEMNGIEATRAIKADCPSTAVVLLTVSNDDKDLLEGIKAGASGYLLKSITAEKLAHALRSLPSGELPLPPGMAKRLLTEFRSMARRMQMGATGYREGLTERELEVLKLVACGLDNREIASRLYVSEKTVKNHIRSILDKLQLRNRIQAATYAVRQGLVDRSMLDSTPPCSYEPVET